MRTIKNEAILENLKCNIKEVIINMVVDNFCSYNVNLNEIKIEFDEANESIIHITLPKMIKNKN